MPKLARALIAALPMLIPLAAQAAPLQPPLAGLAFLLGAWTSGNGHVAETGGTSKGTASFTAAAGGGVLLRQDHVALFGKTGKPTGTFDILMTIYAEGTAIHADYFDGDHIIHYTTATLTPNAVTFATTPSAAAPAFHLTYQRTGPTLAITFTMAPPGQTKFSPIATGTMQHKG